MFSMDCKVFSGFFTLFQGEFAYFRGKLHIGDLTALNSKTSRVESKFIDLLAGHRKLYLEGIAN